MTNREVLTRITCPTCEGRKSIDLWNIGPCVDCNMTGYKEEWLRLDTLRALMHPWTQLAKESPPAFYPNGKPEPRPDGTYLYP